jgi:hypothetical protein
MNGTVIYEIARYGVDTDQEVLVERAQLLRTGGNLSWRLAGDEERPCTTDNLVDAIAATPALFDVHPDHVTRIHAVADVVQELPLLLRPTGEWGDIDESLWSEEMSFEHLGGEVWDLLPFDSNRVLYVNDEPWNTWHTSDADRMLPAGDSEPLIATQWARASLYESAPMNSGETNSVVGLLTSTIVSVIYTPSSGDPVDEDDPGSIITLHRWDHTAESAGNILADWITASPVDFYFYHDGTFADPKFFVQLLIEAASNTETYTTRTPEQLIEACGYDMDYFNRTDGDPPSTDFGLHLDVEPDVIEAALAAVAKADPEYADMITAARNLQSPQALVRAERVAAIRAEFYE